MNDPRNASARAKGATSRENDRIQWEDVERWPFLVELQRHGVTVDVKAVPERHVSEGVQSFLHSGRTPGVVWLTNRLTGRKVWAADVPAQQEAP